MAPKGKSLALAQFPLGLQPSSPQRMPTSAGTISRHRSFVAIVQERISLTGYLLQQFIILYMNLGLLIVLFFDFKPELKAF